MPQKRHRIASLKTALAAAALTALLISPRAVNAAGITGLSLNIPHGAGSHENSPPDELLVSASVDPGSLFVKELRGGVKKEIIIYVDIFRKWHSWPDEFIFGKKIERDMVCDSIKSEYFLTTSEAGKTEKKIYPNCRGLMKDAFSLKNIKLSNLKELNSARYIVRVTAESKANNISSLLGQVFFFVQEYEFKASADSQIMTLGTKP